MSSPIQPPPNIRSPSVGSQQSSQSTSGAVSATAPSVPSPYSHHLPPPSNLAQNAGSPSIVSQQRQPSPSAAAAAAQSMSNSLPPPPPSRCFSFFCSSSYTASC
ncbi:hypothetical protein G6F42_019080 [Rhizopus arrhizus]|nr:hypothetical protein G6F42_019080 [Rhizopus arrhizus]